MFEAMFLVFGVGLGRLAGMWDPTIYDGVLGFWGLERWLGWSDSSVWDMLISCFWGLVRRLV
jgi:hypothetical protein